MKRIGFLIAVLVTAASAVTAQDVVVRSGEHDGFTRLVFDVPPDTRWMLAQRKNGASLTIAPTMSHSKPARFWAFDHEPPGLIVAGKPRQRFGTGVRVRLRGVGVSVQKLDDRTDIAPGELLPPLENVPPP